MAEHQADFPDACPFENIKIPASTSYKLCIRADVSVVRRKLARATTQLHLLNHEIQRIELRQRHAEENKLSHFYGSLNTQMCIVTGVRDQFTSYIFKKHEEIRRLRHLLRMHLQAQSQEQVSEVIADDLELRI